MVRGKPGTWVVIAVATVVPVFLMPGVFVPVALVVALGAMIAAVTRAYQDAARHEAAREVTTEAGRRGVS
jgi:chromate transport protein ChrA